MRLPRIPALLSSLLLFVSVDGARSALADCDVVPGRVVVRFRHGAIVEKVKGRRIGLPSDVTLPSQAMVAVFNKHKVKGLRKLLPDFKRQHIRPNGSVVELPVDMSDVFVIDLDEQDIFGAIRDLKALGTDVEYAEPDHIVHVHATPNDPKFGLMWPLENTGIQGSPSDIDMDASAAWDHSTGAGSNVKVAVIDTGIDNTHPDLGNVTMGVSYYNTGNAYDDSPGHGTAIAGIIGATGNNATGITGVNWGAQPVAIKALSSTGAGNTTDLTNGVQWAQDHSIPIVNISCGYNANSSLCGDFDSSLRDALKNARTTGMLIVSSMGNNNNNAMTYPAGYHSFVTSVGAIGLFKHRWVDNPGPCSGQSNAGSSWGDWIDLSAPGGRFIVSTLPVAQGSYQEANPWSPCSETLIGTSVAAAYVSGSAALLKAANPILNGEDLEGVLTQTADDILDQATGWDETTGAGLLNLNAAVSLVTAPNSVVRGETYMVSDSESPEEVMTIMNTAGLNNGQYRVIRHTLSANVSFPRPFIASPKVWARPSESLGWGSSNPHDDASETIGYGQIVAGSITRTGCTVRTYIYEVFPYFGGQRIGWFPTTGGPAHVAWTAAGVEEPDASLSYFAPQADSIGGVTKEGQYAIKFFRACPNNDGGASLPNNARLKVSLKKADGTPLAGFPADSIYALFNGGTAAQGFSGNGADSIIANGTWNTSPACPTVTRLTADAATDTLGVTYITLEGSTPGSPGVGTRDPNRKWGHYDSNIPVVAGGVVLSGRYTSNDANGTYEFRVKNFDFLNGLTAVMNQGEVVSSADINNLANKIGVNDALSYWRDFDSSGEVAQTDFNMLNNGHAGHNCITPNNP